jgi:GntR family transcriptional regulator
VVWQQVFPDMSPPDPTDARPLYAKVREQLVERIRSGVWKPGQLIPSEFEIAAEFGVSQGTARKAIGALATERLVMRQQGRGTFVVEHTPAHVLFRFFNMFDAAGELISPDSRQATCTVAPADGPEQMALHLAPGADVIRIGRIRTRDGIPFICETIRLPQELFPDLAQIDPLPNTLYDLFQKTYGILLVRTEDRLSATAADAATAHALNLPAGAPLLQIDRRAFGLDDRPIEWRVSLCHLQDAHYLART